MACLKRTICLILLAFISCKQGTSPKSATEISQTRELVFETILLDSLPKPQKSSMGPILTKSVGKTQTIEYTEKSRTILPTIIKPGGKKLNQSQPTKTPLIEQKVKSRTPQINTAKPPNFPDYNPLNFNIYTLTSGLIDSKIHDILQDSKGNIWFSSYLGVSKYNGHTYENFSQNQGLIDGYVEHVYEDYDGNIWFSHRKGVSRFDGENMSNFYTESTLLKEGINQTLQDKNGNFWFASYASGLCKVEKNKLEEIICFSEVPGKINAILEDKKGNIWIASEQNGLIKYDGQSFYQISTASKSISCLKESKDGSIWFGSLATISQYDGEAITSFDKLGNSFVKNIMEDDSETIWFSTKSDGVFNLKENQINHINISDGLPSDETDGILQDKAGNIWIGTYQGAVKYNKMFSSIYYQDGLTSKSVRSLFEDTKGNIWAGCDLGGLSYFNLNAGTITNFNKKNGLGGQNINSITEDQDKEMWFGFWDGPLSKLSADRKTITQYLDSGEALVSLYTDHKGDLWYSSREKEGVFKINKKANSRTHYTVEQGLVDPEIIQISQDVDSNYIFTTFAGVSILNKEQSILTNYPKTEGQNLSIIESCYQDHTGAYWLSSLVGEGLFRVNPKTKKISQFGIEDGLPSNILLTAIQDDKKNMWLNTRNGIAKIDKKALDSLDSQNHTYGKTLFTSFGQENNFPGSGDGRYFILKDKLNRLWIPQLDKVSLVDLHEVRQTESEIEAELLNFKLFNENINWTTDSSYTLKNGLKVGRFKFNGLIENTAIPLDPILPYDNNFVSFEFVGIDVNKPKSVKYQYQLEGLEKNWSSIANTPEATYGNLSPGKYTFKVKAMNEAGVWSNISQYHFSITPPWWKTWWAYLFYISFALLLIYAWTRYNVYLTLEKYKATQAMRAKISTDLHDDVGSILSGLSMKSELMSYSADETQQKELTTLSEMSRDAMERMRDTVWAMDARKDKYENLTDRMRSFAENNLPLKNITYDFKVESPKTGEFISPEIRQNVYLIFKEAITNILKHSDAKHVTITFNKKGNTLTLKISDNGSKKNTSSSDGLGMSNMKARAESLKGTLKSYFKNGFTVDLEIPTNR